MSCPSGQKKYSEETRTSAGRLQQELFLLLSDVIEHIATTDLHRLLQTHVKVPEIWMNGRGVILEATYPATVTSTVIRIQNRHSNLRNHELQERGYWMALTLEDLMQRNVWETNTSLNRDDHLYALFDAWGDLRMTHWVGWQSQRLPVIE
jgi:hypothetical protein